MVGKARPGVWAVKRVRHDKDGRVGRRHSAKGFSCSLGVCTLFWRKRRHCWNIDGSAYGLNVSNNIPSFTCPTATTFLQDLTVSYLEYIKSLKGFPAPVLSTSNPFLEQLV